LVHNLLFWLSNLRKTPLSHWQFKSWSHPITFYRYPHFKILYESNLGWENTWYLAIFLDYDYFCNRMTKHLSLIMPITSRDTNCSRCSIYIRTVSSQNLLTALLNWFKLVYAPFGQCKVHCTLDFWPDQPGRKTSNVPKLKIS
jgi:hypothetical protein